MKKYVVLDKKIGETPLSLLDTFRLKNPRFKNKKLAYAGRLDPMASGKLLALIGDECKKQGKYLALDKEYKFEVLLNFSSDTGDVLGIAEYHNNTRKEVHKEIFKKEQLKNIAKKLTGKISMQFPSFSSKTVKGKPIFLWALENRLGEIDIPIKHSNIYKLTFEEIRTISKEELLENILKKIDSIPKILEQSKALGEDFRREKIREKWNSLFSSVEKSEFQVVMFTCITSSGTYMRSLADEIGKTLNTRGLAYSIHRTKIGKYKKIFKSVGFWYKKY